MRQLVVTCDAAPVPPLNGHNRKAHDVIESLRGSTEIAIVAYSREGTPDRELREYWERRGVKVRLLRRRLEGRYLRVLRQRLSIPTVTRDFDGEQAAVRDLGCGEDARLLVDFISGAPLACRYRTGVVVSGHDCMSLLFREEARHAERLGSRARFLVRSWFALRSERRFAHIPAVYHVVSERDAAALRAVNARARTAVIPIGGRMPEEAALPEPSQRQVNLIWGNLGSEVIAQGFDALLRAAAFRGREELKGWEVVGQIPCDEARRRFPLLSVLGLRYIVRLSDVTESLGRVKILLLPDVAGAGQKNRVMDGLAHGCCVAGLDEVFHGVDGGCGADAPYVRAGDAAELLEQISRMTRDECLETGRRGRRHFASYFDLGRLGPRWLEILESAGPLREV